MATVQELMDRLATVSPNATVQLIDTNSGYTYVPDIEIQPNGDSGVSEEDIAYTDERICWIPIEEA